ncbi:MAG: sensor histidine kinase [Halobacteriales archaeon]
MIEISRVVGTRMTPDGLLDATLRRPSGVALAYFLFGITWILSTDTIVLALFDDNQTVTFIQTAKGWVFVFGSTVFIFGLTWYGTNTLQRTNERLDLALRQMGILHRIIRHNLRNNCNVIHGNVELLLNADERDIDDRLRIIRSQAERLIELSEKTHYLRDLMLEGSEEPQRLDLVVELRSVVERMRRQYPEATIEADLPATIRYESDPRLRRVFHELLDNAMAHHDRDEPSVRVGARVVTDAAVEITIQDDGPGMPDMERDVLQQGHETPMFHSQGLGLWIARSIVLAVGGEIRIVDNEPRGTVVNLRLP